MVSSEAPNKCSMGRFRSSPRTVRTRPLKTIMTNELPMMASASWSLPRPRSMEHSGAPPMPNKLAKAMTMEMMGRQRPRPVRAMVAFSGIRPM